MAKFGCLLIIVAFVALFGIVVIPVLPPLAENAGIDNYLTALLCQDNEIITRDQYSTTDSDGTSYSMDVYCTDRERQQRDVTGNWILIGVVSFVAPFLIGLFMFIGGVNRGAASSAANIAAVQLKGKTVQIPGGMSVSSFSASPSDQLEIKDGVVRFGGMEIRPDAFTGDRIEDFMNQWKADAPGADTLTDKLRQLQDARDAGLINADEYTRLRQEILDKLA